MNFNELISLCNPTNVSGPEPNDIGVLQHDSRKVSPDDVFIAIRGIQADGHEYVKEAVARGASVVIIQEPVSTEEEVCIIQVADTRGLLGPLAQAFAGNPAQKMKIIGITGTNGKTTVATLTYQILQQLNVTPALLGTTGKWVGGQTMDSNLTTSDPVELAKDMQQAKEAGATHLIMEVSSHALDQQRVNGIDFDIAAFTNLSHDHLDYHQDLNNYAQAKAKLFISLNPQAKAIINGDDEYAIHMIEECQAEIIRFSFNKALEVECQVLSNNTEGLVIRIGKILIESSLMGTFNAYNITEAFLICRSFGFKKEAIAEALGKANGAPGRLERLPRKEKTQPLVLVDYAHTPDALENVLRTLSDIKTEQETLHVVFGCGGNRDHSKRPKMAAIAEKYANKVILTSDNPRDEDPDAIIEEVLSGFKNPENIERITDRRKAIVKAVTNADKDAIILIAGKGHETYQEVKGERHHFDDKEIALDALDNRKSNAKNTGG
ncbi:UDP-N-acetylmuramoyl-L-alanyl-D-glutamate--2,6-diaminopimelate ligase [Aliifodinibius salicampi]|uniref:UDP-N-acetylmuramoyl-L-alanyl-D-glutamate--2,6-diaminopimelate ligase n=1 Tax=Fodinibius salicampi TaxID=1920655 RepID=A0ABT3PZC3_9BACT|nr:UDP-N-acetylmuramoyl-L-alanyl-D-glutamate--2,6-diaminopimelate ligase [Fodinibius salicampi]MCW9713178.1 UDP-N-acetylmuramoyl-L-alanyl-D-glutamate--2,6-diaminopimelate ligase [Fodinibius salicampi]